MFAKTFYLLAFTFICFSNSKGFAQDIQEEEPDAAVENRFHHLYKTYNELPTSGESWAAALSRAKGETYDVQKGDNLWNLSETLFGDPNYWPKIWSVNAKGIENPHEVSMGQSIRFVPGSMSEAPSVAVTQGSREKAMAMSSQAPAPSTEMEDLLKRVQIPEPLKSPRKKNKIPSSLPQWELKSDEAAQTGLAKSEISTLGYLYRDETVLTHYITEDALEELGRVEETESDASRAAMGEYVVLRFDTAPDGKNYLIVKQEPGPKDPATVFRNPRLITIQGEVQVLGPVNESRGLYRALVTRLVAPVEVGSNIVRGNVELISTSRGPHGPEVAASVIGGDNAVDQKMMMNGSLVYLNLGSQAGLEKGQLVPIYRDLALRKESTRAVRNNLKIGTAKILKVTPAYATAILIDANGEIRTGDMTTANPP